MIDREYKGHRYRVMQRINESGKPEFFIHVPRKTWFGFGSEVWKPFTQKSYKEKSPYAMVSVCYDIRIDVLLCWTTSSEQTDTEFKAFIDAREQDKINKKKSKEFGERPVEVK